jgi:hypothetical protein
MYLSSRILPAALAWCAWCGLACAPAQAEAIPLLAPSALSASNTVAVYPEPVGLLPTGSYSLAAGGNTLTFIRHYFERLDQGGFVSGRYFPGNFTPGTRLLRTANEPSGAGLPIDIYFAAGVGELGFQWAQHVIGLEVLELTAFNGAVNLGTFSFAGLNNDRADGSAPFAGLRAINGSVITHVRLTPLSTADLLLGPISFGPPVAAIPEPSPLLLLGFGLLAVLRRRVKFRQ